MKTLILDIIGTDCIRKAENDSSVREALEMYPVRANFNNN
jgi:hypothetical protein